MNRKDFRPNDNSSSNKTSMATVPKRKVVDNFLDGKGGKTGNNSISTDGKTLKSYNTVIALRQSNGTIIVNNTKYSSTTSSQQNYLMSELKKGGHKYEVTGDKDRGYEGEDFARKDEIRKQNEETLGHTKNKDRERDYSKEYNGEYRG